MVTVGMLREFLKDIPDDTPITVDFNFFGEKEGEEILEHIDYVFEYCDKSKNGAYKNPFGRMRLHIHS